MSKNLHRFQARIPDSLYEKLEVAALAAGNSVNSELIKILNERLELFGSSIISERRKSDLLRELNRWCRAQGRSINGDTIKEFAECYNTQLKEEDSSFNSKKYVLVMPEIPFVSSRYLHELHRVWNKEHPLQMAEDYNFPLTNDEPENVDEFVMERINDLVKALVAFRK